MKNVKNPRKKTYLKDVIHQVNITCPHTVVDKNEPRLAAKVKITDIGQTPMAVNFFSQNNCKTKFTFLEA